MTTHKPQGSARRRSAVAMTAAAALVLAACGNGDDGNGDGGNGTADNGGAEAAGGGTVSAYNCEPQNLMPSNSTEVCGSWVLEQLFTGLTQVDYETYEAVPGVATDWESNEDQTEWTFTLGEDWTFHNGDPIDANTFVETFNWVVDPDNAQQNTSFYDVIVGYEDVVNGDAEELAGVTATDDYTLEFELNEPFSPLPMMLSYTGFYPMPAEAFEDPESFEQAPVGNGRYQMDGEWEHDVQIAVDRYEDWPGEDPGVPERIEWQIYNDIETAYLDVQAGTLDIMDSVPPNRLSTMEADFGDNQTMFDTSSFTYMGLPLYQEEFQDKDVRHALSMAIDRQLIIDNIFDGAQVPAGNIIPPMLPSAREDACDYCDFDPEAAAELYEEADGPSELTIYFNSGAGHEDWVEAVSNQWQEHLGIENISFESLEFAQYLDLHDNQEVTGPFRLGWVLSYPSPQYAMEPIYTTGKSSNYADFSNEEFDNLIAEANAADPEEADSIYQEAEDILLEEMPVIPMFFQSQGVVHSDRIQHDSVQMDPRTFLRVEQLVVNEE
ncbi:peptide ABC transporter substrate-binding protein [Garicola koreensis]|uniref:Peptide/nickel transport system substrate-binding protein/oligopeptide transport system substrate-binding protein n=1 Tax=Garicola koreensis TaxID=1262554 RepID=A0A7W5TUE7_9MICC|nr:ABC transporter substrate-binding protein [Garicola koreensis]MBB3667469.1 peptide/nickel transport system substrate-binding protein/oligopeptide transport system substrate-binding protein [Garicola koreensis]MBB3667678.1 peptide/nickel transport system substrate-binding protein/oligopeptide transport system substrate-binding protein [Garicola koreensis]